MYLWLTDQICLLEVVFDPGLSDHMLIYGIMKEKTKKHSGNIIQLNSYKNFDPVKEEKEEASKGQRHTLYDDSTMEKCIPNKEKGF